MTRYIGLDVHAQSTALAVISDSGRKISSQVLETSARALITAISVVPRPRHLIMEEGTQSAWLAELLSPHVEDVVVCVPRKRSNVAKNDVADAFARAEELRRNAVDRRVFKPKLTALRYALNLYAPLTKDVVRTKGRYKALLRSRGIHGFDGDPYDPSPDELRETLKKLPVGMHFPAEALLEEIYLLEDLRSRAADVLVGEAEKHPCFDLLSSAPGFGPIRVATLLAVLVTPERFRKTNHFWSYCGLGVQTVVTGEYGFRDGQRVRQRAPLTRGLKHGNAMLKNVFKGAATSIIQMRPDEPLKVHYERLLAGGMKEPIARVTLARKLAAIILAMWKKKETYDPTKHSIHQ